MDDFVLLARTRWHLREAIAAVYRVALDDGRVVSCVLYDDREPLDGGDLTSIIGVTP